MTENTHIEKTNTEPTEQLLLSITDLPEPLQQELTSIFTGQALPPLYSNIIAKTIFNADIHPERFNFLMRSIAKDETIEVKSSAGNDKAGAYRSGLCLSVIRTIQLNDTKEQKSKRTRRAEK